VHRSLHAIDRFGRVVTSLAVLLATSGCLYLAAGIRWGGPRMPDALPLDELSHRDAVSLLWFVLVWGVAAAAIAMLIRPFGLDRVRSGVAVALCLWVWTYPVTAVSVMTVRQIPAEDAFQAAAMRRAVVLPALLGLFAGALVAQSDASDRRMPQLLSWLVATLGLVGVVDAYLPTHSATLLSALAPAAAPFAHGAMLTVSVGLVYLSRPLGRASRRAWLLACLLLAGVTLLHVLHSDLGAIATGGVAALLLARRSDFQVAGDPAGRSRALRALVVMAALAYAAGLFALLARAHADDRAFHLSASFRAVSETVLGLPGGMHTGLAAVVLVLALIGGVVALVRWLAPWQGDRPEGGETRARAREIVRECGSDTLAPFVLRADKAYLFSPSGRSVVAYRVVAGVAVVSGDPVGPEDDRDLALDALVRRARERGWRIVVLGASEAYLASYRRRGLRALYHGDEAVLDLDRFSLEGRPIRKVRQSVTRLEKAGYTAGVVPVSEVTPDLRSELEAVERAWRGNAPVRGYAMAMDELFRLEGDEALFVIGRRPDGEVAGFLHFAVSPAGDALSLSTMPRLRDTPNGFNEWLVCAAAAWARAQGYARMSLNFAPFAALLAPGVELRPVQRVERRLLLALKGHFQLDNLLHFNRKFFPEWQRRFVVYERRTDLPRVGFAALAAEAYLPFRARS